MGLFGWITDRISDAVEFVVEKVGDAVDWVTDKLSGSKYESSNMENHVDVDRVLEDFRKSIDADVQKAETNCMEHITEIFEDLKDKTSERFPDLVEIISEEQKKAKNEMSGTIMRYVKEHLSKNDAKFLRILEMAPGAAKKEALGTYSENVINAAEKHFNSKLSKYAKNILNEFTGRLETRIEDQELQLKIQIEELEHLKEQAERGELDVEELKAGGAVVMEAAGCILSLMETEM